jgi:hypothetical protein
MKFEFTLYAMVLLAGLLVVSGPVRADQDPSENGKKREQIAARTLLEEGQASGSLPAGVVVRVAAQLDRSVDEDKKARAEAKARGVVFQESLHETWEFTSNQVHRVIMEHKNGDYVYRRVDSRPFDAKNLCKELIDGKAIEIMAREGKGKLMPFVDTNYTVGWRSIEILWNGKTVLELTEGCADGGYAESDARAFAALYERLASQARVLFKAEAADAK